MRISAILAAILICISGNHSAFAQSDGSNQSGSAEPAPGQNAGSGSPPPASGDDFSDNAAEAQKEPSEEATAALAMIDGALKKIDEEIEREGNGWQFEMGDNIVLIATDPIAERMRIMIPIAPANALTPDVMRRIMQANFDSALDARYAVAQNLLWGTFIHSLTGLDEKEFLSGLLQTINIVQTFGTSFSSGVVVFGGGDSQAIINNQLEELQKERDRASKT